MKILKTLLVLGGLAVGLHQAGATLISSGTLTLNQTVTDNNASGIVNTFVNSSTSISSITNVRVNITMSGGFNGDLYAYLTHDGATAILLNRIGTAGTGTFGSSQSGMNIWFNDAITTTNVHTAGPLGSGSTYQSDGRDASPTDLAAVNGVSATRTLTSFNTQQAFGTWTLFVSDLSGGATSTFTSWDMEIEGVPEPVNMALISMSICFIGGHVIMWVQRKRVGRI